jgi:hypothetical protein
MLRPHSPLLLKNNLHEINTFKWLEEMQKRGYRVEIYYIGVSNLHIANIRIQERVKRGEHYVPADEVFARYKNGMKLLRHYFSMPDKILFIDNTNGRFTCLEIEKGKIIFHLENSPEWINDFVISFKEDFPSSVRLLNTVDEVRKSYEELKKNSESLKSIFPSKEQQSQKKLDQEIDNPEQSENDRQKKTQRRRPWG